MANPSRRTSTKPRRRPLRLEWVRAGDLADNPRNWRRHPAGQVLALKEVLADRAIGWAGALLYNERTHRLIDGHARRDAVPPDTRVPVLVGRWSEEAERRILATLDPLGDLAEADPARLGALLEDVPFDSDGLEALAASLQAELEAGRPLRRDPGAGAEEPGPGTREAGVKVRCPKCGHRFTA